jgi:signal transduction histidine kinase
MAEDDSLHADEALFAARILRALADEEEQALADLLSVLGRIFACQTVAIFWKDGRSQAWGKGAAAAERAALTGQSEPVVELCFQTGRAQLVDKGGSPLFAEEKPRRAFPLAEGVALYLGQPRRWHELKASRLVGHLSGFLITSERWSACRRRAEQQSTQVQRLDSTLQMTRRCLEALGEEAPSLDSAVVIERSLAGLRDQIPYCAWFVVRDAEIFGSVGGLSREQRSSLLELAATTTSSRAVETLASTPYRSLASLANRMLATPLKGGALLLFGDQAYDAHHRATLALLASYLSVALEQAGLHATAVQAQAQLVQANRLAAVGQLAAGLAHELNNPLGSITLALDTCHRFVEKNPKVALSVLADAQKAAARAHDIVTKLLHFSRDSRAGQRTCYLADILEETRAVVEPLLAQDAVRLELDVTEPRPLYLNPGEVGQALSNLIINARDAVLEVQGQRVVSVSSQASGPFTQLRVRDCGPGISEPIRERIFEPFFTTKPVGRGTGLGLSLARQMVEAQGGRLELEATQAGACFCVTLPVSSEHPAQPE